MICGFPTFPRICSKFFLLIWYSNICLIVLYQFGILCYGMFLMACISELECCFNNLIINFYFWFSSFGLILALHRTLLVRHFSLREHWYFLTQLHVLAILSFERLIIFCYVYQLFFCFFKQSVKFVKRCREKYLLILGIDFRLLSKHFFCMGDCTRLFFFTLFDFFVFVVYRFLVS